MFNAKSFTRLISLAFLAIIFAVVTGCSSGDTATSNSSAGTGSVALLLTDAPSDIFEEINITVTKAELLSDDGAVTIFQGERTFDLLDLTDARIFAIREGIAAGTYNKIRLTLTEIELVDYNDQNDRQEFLKYYPNLPGNGKLDLNPRGSFDVVSGGTLTIQIDMDANKSVHIVGNGAGKYQFRPVVFITVINSAITDRLVKLQGDIDSIDTSDESFKLCNTNIPVQRDDDGADDSSTGCIRVTSSDTTSIFDINGKPASFSALVEGEPATVFGRLLRELDSDDDFDDDEKDDDSDEKDNDDERELDDLVLKAALIELGPHSNFEALKGIATSAVDSNNLFTMDVDAGQGYATPLTLSVQIQDGTILINREGNPVDSSAIDNLKIVSVRGVLDVDNKTLFASLIIVDTDSSSKLTGTVGANPDNSCGFTLMTADGDRSIATDSNTKAYLVTDGSSDPINVADLSGQTADVYGEDVNGCFAAHTIIAY